MTHRPPLLSTTRPRSPTIPSGSWTWTPRAGRPFARPGGTDTQRPYWPWQTARWRSQESRSWSVPRVVVSQHAGRRKDGRVNSHVIHGPLGRGSPRAMIQTKPKWDRGFSAITKLPGKGCGIRHAVHIERCHTGSQLKTAKRDDDVICRIGRDRSSEKVSLVSRDVSIHTQIPGSRVAVPDRAAPSARFRPEPVSIPRRGNIPGIEPALH